MVVGLMMLLGPFCVPISGLFCACRMPRINLCYTTISNVGFQIWYLLLTSFVSTVITLMHQHFPLEAKIVVVREHNSGSRHRGTQLECTWTARDFPYNRLWV